LGVNTKFMCMWQKRGEASNDDDRGDNGGGSSGRHNVQMFR
jgi:hypothetical protein